MENFPGRRFSSTIINHFLSILWENTKKQRSSFAFVNEKVQRVMVNHFQMMLQFLITINYDKHKSISH